MAMTVSTNLTDAAFYAAIDELLERVWDAGLQEDCPDEDAIDVVVDRAFRNGLRETGMGTKVVPTAEDQKVLRSLVHEQVRAGCA
jgi:hypothetical protein